MDLDPLAPREHHHRDDREKAMVGMQVDYFVELLSRRYKIEPQDVVDAVRWVQHHKETAERFRNAGVISLIGVVASALAISVWEGIKAALRGGRVQ